MNAHTPGPWTIGYDSTGMKPYAINAAAGGIVNWGGISRKASAEGLANARLIAAAPRMADALQQIIALPDARCDEAATIARAALRGMA